MNILEHMSDFYDRQGKVITLEEYGMLMADFGYKSIGYDLIGDFLVSTAWLGANHNFSDDSDPLIFETMIFESGGPTTAPHPVPHPPTATSSPWQFDNYQTRYATEEEAIVGHAEAIKTVLDKTRVFVNDQQT